MGSLPLSKNLFPLSALGLEFLPFGRQECTPTQIPRYAAESSAVPNILFCRPNIIPIRTRSSSAFKVTPDHFCVFPGRLDGPTSSTLRSLARFNSGGYGSETEGVDGDIMDAVIRTATASMDRRPMRDRRRPSPANSASASRDSVERQKC